MEVQLSGNTHKHIKNECIQGSHCLDTAHSLWLNSLQIHPDASYMTSGELENACTQSSQTPLEVLLVLNISKEPSVSSTSYSLQIQIDKTCCKTFEFSKDSLICIPLSTTRPTSVTIQAHREGQKLHLQHFMGNESEKQLMLTNENILVKEDAILDVVGAALDVNDHNHIKWTFKCARYNRDNAPLFMKHYDMQQFGTDLEFLHNNFKPVPSKNISFISTSMALRQLTKLERDRAQLLETLQACRLQTVVEELGATAEDAQVMIKNIDWKQSYLTTTLDLSCHLHETFTMAWNTLQTLRYAVIYKQT